MVNRLSLNIVLLRPEMHTYTGGRPSYDLIKKTLGWEPKVGIEEGMRRTYNHYIRHSMEQVADSKCDKGLVSAEQFKRWKRHVVAVNIAKL